jgi:hypothetical protein
VGFTLTLNYIPIIVAYHKHSGHLPSNNSQHQKTSISIKHRPAHICEDLARRKRSKQSIHHVSFLCVLLRKSMRNLGGKRATG